MLEIERAQIDARRGGAWTESLARGLALGLARSNEDLEAIQRLRFNVFSQEMGAVFPEATDGLDCDRYDPWCEHVMVKEVGTGRVVGTYRVLTPPNAKKAGGYYSETEFDLTALNRIRNDLVEVGRSCTHSDYRGGSVIMLLLSGVARLVHRSGFRYILGCASVSLRDDGVTAAEVWRATTKMLGKGNHPPLATPRYRYPVERINSTLPARVPPLIKGYLRLGATICGEPAWDPDFNTADFPVFLDMNCMDIRYRRRFGLD